MAFSCSALFIHNLTECVTNVTNPEVEGPQARQIMVTIHDREGLEKSEDFSMG